MRLIYTRTSPYSRKVLVLAAETGLADRIEVEAIDPWPSGSDVPSYNPLGKVPALVLDDGRVLFDSPVICEYLDDLHTGTKYFPPAGDARWAALKAQAVADGLLDATVLIRLESLRPEDKRLDTWRKRQIAAVRRGLVALEAEADDLVGPPDIRHVSVGCALGYLDFRFGEEDWRSSNPKLSAWFEAWNQRPSMTSTAPPEG